MQNMTGTRRLLYRTICHSQTIAQLDMFQEIFLYRLIASCDDFGRYHADTRLLLAFLFPLRREVTEQMVEAAIEKLCELHVIALYRANGAMYLEMVNWTNYQKIKSPKPGVPGPESEISEALETSETSEITSKTHDECWNSNMERIEIEIETETETKTKTKLEIETEKEKETKKNSSSCVVPEEGTLKSTKNKKNNNKNKKNFRDILVTCAELSEREEKDAAPFEPRVEFLLEGGTGYVLSALEAELLSRGKDWVKMDDVLVRARSWLLLNAKAPKDRRELMKFLTSWIDREKISPKVFEKPSEKPSGKASEKGGEPPGRNAALGYDQRSYPPGYFDDFFADLSKDSVV